MRNVLRIDSTAFTTPTFNALGKHLKTRIVSGIVVVMPLAVTAFILSAVFFFLDDILRSSYVNRYYHVPFWIDVDEVPRGVGFITLMVAIYLIGLVSSHGVGRRLVQAVHRLMGSIPIVRAIYRTAKEFTDFLSVTDSHYRHSRVVMLDFPREGIKSLGLVTHRMKGKDGKFMLAIYIPTTPNPMSGYLVIVPEDQATPVDIPVEDAMRMVISGGILSPDSIGLLASEQPTPHKDGSTPRP